MAFEKALDTVQPLSDVMATGRQKERMSWSVAHGQDTSI